MAKYVVNRNLVSLAVHSMPGRVIEHGTDTVLIRDMQGGMHTCPAIHFVEQKNGIVYFAAGKAKYIGQEDLDPTSANLAWQPHIPIEENLLSHVSRTYGLKALAAPAGVSLTTDEGIAVVRTAMQAPDYAVALIWFYIFGSYTGEIRFSDVVWTGEPGRSLLYIRQGGKEAHIVGLARDYVAFWWGLSGGWGNAPDAFLPLPSYIQFRDYFRILEPDPSRSRFLNVVQAWGWEPDATMRLPEESLFELDLKTHSIYFGRMSNSLFPITFGARHAYADALPYPASHIPWDRKTRVDCAMKFRVPRASLATVLGLPKFVV